MLTPEFKSHFKEKYGSWGGTRPDYSRCAKSVADYGRGVGSHQCARKNGHGPHGAYCKQHDPIAVKAKNDVRHAEWKRKYDEEKTDLKFRKSCVDAILQIANGHNDPRGLALSIMSEAGEEVDAIKAEKGTQ